MILPFQWVISFYAVCCVHLWTNFWHVYYSCCDWYSSFISDISVQKNIRKNEEHNFEFTGTLHTCSCWAYTKTFCISFLNDSWCTSKIELSIEWYFSSSKDAFHSHLSCLPHQHKRPYIQAISFLPFTSPQALVQDQKHNRRQFLCSNYFLVSEMITLQKFKKKKKERIRSWRSKSAKVAKT